MNKLTFVYLRYGKEHLESYNIINNSKPEPSDLLNIKFFLLCRSIEYSLKAFLLDCGYVENELKLKFGHDLDKLLSDVIKKLKSIQVVLYMVSEADESVINKISKIYKCKEFEYFKEGVKVVPWLIDLQSTAKNFNKNLQKNLEFDRSLPRIG